MNVIYKYPLMTADEQRVDMPRGAHILSVDVQRGVYCLWALVDPQAEKEQRTFAIIGTGHPIADAARLDYIGSAQLGEALIFHVFEKLGATG